MKNSVKISGLFICLFLMVSNAVSVAVTDMEHDWIKIYPAEQDPFAYLLTGDVSKTWKLYRVGPGMGVGPSLDSPNEWWFLENNGTRPCAYYHEFTFYKNGDYGFDDKGFMWGEAGVFHEDLVDECIEAIPSNMVGPNGEDLSAWLSGMHIFEYNSNTNMVTLNGLGAWIGLVLIGTNGDVNVPQNSVSFNVEIEELDGYDYMHVWFEYDAGYVWSFYYAYYHDPSLEPDVVEEQDSWGEDLPNITPEEIFITFAARDAENMATIDTVASGSIVKFGVDDPMDPSAQKVGEFIRTAGIQWQELQFRTSPVLYDIQFDNFDAAKIDVYIPADTEFSYDGLQKYIWFGFANMSETQNWWESPIQFNVEGDDVVVGAWHTYTFDLTEVKERDDLDMIYLGIGGGGHAEEGIFYIRNLIFGENDLPTLTTSTKEHDWIKIFPNPNPGLFTLELNQQLAGTTLVIQIYDITGKLVFQTREIPDGSHFHKDLDVSYFQKGVYFLRITGKDMVGVKQIIVN